MPTIEEMKASLVPEYQKKFDILEDIAYKLHMIEETELEMAVIKKMAGLKMMIDHCNGK